VGVVLLEAAYARQAGQRARQLVTVQHPEVGQPEGQLPPGARPVVKHQAGRVITIIYNGTMHTHLGGLGRQVGGLGESGRQVGGLERQVGGLGR